ncbi:MAG: hypothetical protein LBC75_00970 [Fibromonadaceae bacterium]|jgi:hypothetical protein|nr:hypothetical protein [Fibromonadaceae bacterium]
MIVEVSDLCSSCRQIPGLGNMTVEATINTINSKKEKGERPPFSDDKFNAMIYSCISRYRNKDVTHPCLRKIMDMLPPYMKERY